MITISKEKLQILYQYIDLNNPKYELDYLFTSDGYLMATDTRAAIRMKADYTEDIWLHRNVVNVALSVKGAVKFNLSNKSIECLDKKDNSIVAINDTNNERELRNTMNLNKVFPKSFKKKINFTCKSQTNGIFALNGVNISEKHIPRKLPNSFKGVIAINDYNLPVLIRGVKSEDIYENTLDDIEILIMPIVDNYLIDATQAS